MAGVVGNKNAVGNNGGRPPFYETPEDMQAGIAEYFEYIKGEMAEIKSELTGQLETKWVRYPEPATITGLILYLGFSHREALSDYEKKVEFSDIIKKGRTRVEHEYEKRLHGDKNTGAIFALKNMGWKDKIEQEINGNMGITWVEEKTYEAE